MPRSLARLAVLKKSAPVIHRREITVMPRGVMNILGKGQVQIGDGRGGPAVLRGVGRVHRGQYHGVHWRSFPLGNCTHDPMDAGRRPMRVPRLRESGQLVK